MGDQEFSDSDLESDVTKLKKKSLPWHSTSLDLVNADTLSDESLNLADKLQISSNNNLPSNPSPHKSKKFPENALPWADKTGDQTKESEINILLLGESGVGKSTFINSFANYMKHENFEAVQQNSLHVLIPARFHIFDKEFHKQEIKIGVNDENEYLADGAAATQDVKTYVFYITLDNKSYTIRLIDTPGMGDPRGIDQDNKNCDYVLNYLGRLEKIHAICVLLKPTNTRLDVFLNYCVTQILSRLEKSATENISFLFTNTRGQNYTPGDTYTSLELLVQKIKDTNNVVLPLSHKNVFCFDNEAFRFLASIKQGVEFREGILEANIESWKYSYKEVYRLISYVVQLNPHDPKKTVSINRARKMVLQLSQPLAEIVQLIGDNIYQLDQHTHQLLMENQTLEQLKRKLYMPVVDIQVKKLSQPVTICTAPKCSTIYKVADKNKYHYKQRCHNPCYLNNVPAEIVGDPNIMKCWAMTKSTQTCHQCGCRFNTHMHIYYETDTFENKIVDENVLKNISSKEEATQEKQNIMNKILDHKEQLEKEHKYIIKCTAAFAHFLQQNAITPINDSLKEYVKYLITREENLGPETNRATLDYLRQLLSEYEQEKNVLEEALKHSGPSGITSSPNIIEGKIRDLFTLPHFGKKIKTLYDLHQLGGITEHKQSEYVVKELYQLSIADKVKSVILSAFGMGKSKKQHRLELEEQRRLEHNKALQQEYYSHEPPWHSGMPSKPQYNEQYEYLYNFGPYTPRNHYNEWEYNRGEEEENLSYSERRRRYALEYDGNFDENRKVAVDRRKYGHNNYGYGENKHLERQRSEISSTSKLSWRVSNNNENKRGETVQLSIEGNDKMPEQFQKATNKKKKSLQTAHTNIKDELSNINSTDTSIENSGGLKNATTWGKKGNKKKNKKNKK